LTSAVSIGIIGLPIGVISLPRFIAHNLCGAKATHTYRPERTPHQPNPQIPRSKARAEKSKIRARQNVNIELMDSNYATLPHFQLELWH